MIQLGISAEKKLFLQGGSAFAGDKGTTATISLPTYFGGVAIGEFDEGNIYIKYGSDYAEIALEGLTGNQDIDIPDEALAESGFITIWGEFTADSGAVVQKTSLLQFAVGASETYVAPQSGGGD